MTNREAMEILKQDLRETLSAIDNNSRLSFTQNPIGELLRLVPMEREHPEMMDEEFHPVWPLEPENMVEEN